jgi:hypothetical protein
MAKSFTIRANDNPRVFRAVQPEDGADTFSFDFSPWAEDNNAVSSATWSVESGQASVSGESLASNVASALITTSESGKSLIKLTADTGTEIYVVWLSLKAYEPELQSDDYGLCAG